MIRQNSSGKKNSCQCVGLRYIGKFLLPIVSVCCMQAWAEEAQGLVFQGSNYGATNVLAESGTYMASGDSTTLGALQVTASPVTFDFSANPSHKVVFDGAAPDAVFSIRTSCANVVFNGGEWDAGDTGSFYCGGSIWDDFSYGENNVLFYNCVWTNLNRVYVARNVKKCELTMDGNSRVHAKRFFLMYSGSNSGSELNVLGGSGLYLTSDSTTAFYTDNAVGPNNGKVTVSGAGSTIDAGGYQFIVGNQSSRHLLVVSNNASVVAKTLVIGNTASATDSQVLVADGATLTATDISIQNPGCSMTVSNNVVVTAGKLNIGREDSSDVIEASVLITDRSILRAKEITIRNPGCGMTVSNATLEVDSTDANAIKVGCKGRTGGSFVLSGASAEIDYTPEGRVEVFASESGSAEFCIENGATWNLGTTFRSAIKTSNSVFRVTSGGSLVVGQDGTGTLEFGPGTGEYNPALSLSNRFEVCDGGFLQLRQIRLNGNGNEFIVSNATVTFDQTSNDNNEIRLGYKAPKWTDTSWVNRDCALVLRGQNPQIVAPKTSLHIDSGSALRFEIPAEGYANGVIPIKVNKLIYGNYESHGEIDVDCSAFMAKGGKLTLMTVEANDGLTTDKATALIETARATLPEGCTLTVENKKLVLRCPRRRFVFSIR